MRRTVLLLASMVLAVLLACGVALVGVQKPVQAAFPGHNGKIMMESFGGGIYSMNRDGSSRRQLTSSGSHCPAVSPDGTKVAFLKRKSVNDVYVMNMDGTGQKNVTADSPNAGCPKWLPSGTRVGFGGGGNIYTMNADGTGKKAMPVRSGLYDPVWSPDGTKIAFTEHDPNYSNVQIYTMDRDGSAVSKLTVNGTSYDPAWSPDGTKIAFTGYREGDDEPGIYTMDRNGSGQAKIVTDTDTADDNEGWFRDDREPAWSPDGTKIAFLRREAFSSDESGSIFTTSLDGSELRRLTLGENPNYLDPDWAPAPAGSSAADSMPPGPVGALSAAASDSEASLSWTNPADPDLEFVRILRSTYGFATTGWLPTGYYKPFTTQVYQGMGTSFTDTGLDPATTYYYTVFARDKSYNWSQATTTTATTVPAPAVWGPSERLPEYGSSLSASSTVPVELFWSAGDTGTGVARYELQQSVNGGPLTDVVLPAETTTSITPFLESGKTYQYRVRAQDNVGNWSSWKAGSSFSVDRREEAHQAVSYAGTWMLQSAPTASGGYVKHASVSGARAKFSFAGKHVAWVASTGANRGKAEVWVDGVKAQTVDLYSPSAQPRKMVFTKAWSASANHTVEVRALGTKNAASTGSRVDLDAFVALR